MSSAATYAGGKVVRGPMPGASAVERGEPPARPTILVVDDDPAIRRTVQRILSAAGLGSEAACCGREASAMAFRRRPDLAVVDIMMPDISGLELIREWRTNNYLGLHDLPVVVLTGRSDEPDRAAAEVLGVSDYLVKPPDADEFVKRVRTPVRERPPQLFHSPLTGLPGSAALNAEILRRLDSTAPWSALAFNIVGLQRFNQRYGYKQGDLVILSLAAAMSQASLSGGNVYHVGGDLFVELLDSAGLDDEAAAVRETFQLHRAWLYDPEDPAADPSASIAGRPRPDERIRAAAAALTVPAGRSDLSPLKVLMLLEGLLDNAKHAQNAWFQKKVLT